MRLLKKVIISAFCTGMVFNMGIYFNEQKVSAKVRKQDPVVLKLAGSGTMNIYADENLTQLYTYISKSGNYAGDVALLDETDRAYQIRVGGFTGWVRKEEGLIPLTMDEVRSPSYYAINSSNELYHRISTNPTGTSYSTSPVLGPAPAYLEKGVNYYSYDGIYFYDDFLDMIQDYAQNSFDDAVNADEPYYNYYMYLPFHTESNYDGDDLNQYMEDILKWKDLPSSYPAGRYESMLYEEGNSFYEVQEQYGTNALLIFAIAMNESAGQSQYAIERNNLFGLGAIDSNPDEAKDYDSIADCIEKFATYHINWGYLDFYDSRYYGGHVGNKGSGVNVKYASDPYWGEKAAMYYYRVDKALGMKDYQSYTLGIHESDESYKLLKDPKSSSKTIAKISDIPAMPYVVRNETEGYYEIGTDFYLDSDRSILKHNDSLWYKAYDFEENYAYIKADELYVMGEVESSKDEEIIIEDKTLLALINQELNQASDAIITQKQMRSIRELSLDLTGVSSLEGLQKFTHLNSLSLTHLSENLDTSLLQNCSMEEIYIEPKNMNQLNFLKKHSFDKVVIKNFTLQDFMYAQGIDELIIDGGANTNISLFSEANASSLTFLNQQIPISLNHDGEVFTYVNELKDKVGNFISLDNVKVLANGESVISLYDANQRTLTIQAPSNSEIKIEVDKNLKGNVSYQATLTSQVLEEIEVDLSVNGWQQVNSKWVYVENNTLAKGWRVLDNQWYYFNDSGIMVTGWFKDDKMCWYFMDYHTGAMKTGWAADGSSWYYLNPANGIMQTGWQTIDQQKYYLLTSGSTAGSMATGQVEIEGILYEFAQNGIFLRELGGASQPQEPETPLVPENPDSEGPSHPESTKNWWIEESQGWTFYQNGEPVEYHWVADYKNDWYYAGKKGIMLTSSWIARDSSLSVWYYVDENGKMVTNTTIEGCVIDANGEWHA